jgi:hypothetical protein
MTKVVTASNWMLEGVSMPNGGHPRIVKFVGPSDNPTKLRVQDADPGDPDLILTAVVEGAKPLRLEVRVSDDKGFSRSAGTWRLGDQLPVEFNLIRANNDVPPRLVEITMEYLEQPEASKSKARKPAGRKTKAR